VKEGRDEKKGTEEDSHAFLKGEIGWKKD